MEPPPYKDPNRTPEERAADLLARMTIEEKAAQLQTLWQHKRRILGADGVLVPGKAQDVLRHGIGHIARPGDRAERGGSGEPYRTTREAVANVNAIQHWLIENTRLGVPALFHEEALHGLVVAGGTHFPVPLGLASTWDPALLEHVFAAVAIEARARGVQQVLAPVLDLTRDPRWGRSEETYGEDPYLASRLGVAAIRGFQGRGPRLGTSNAIATAKHFFGHGAHEGGINAAPAIASPRDLRERLLAPFEAAVKEAGVMSVMPSYNEVDGIPSHANHDALQRILRDEWGFGGTVVADYQGIEQLETRHHVAVHASDAARQALAAGVDVELPDPHAYPTLVDQVKGGVVAEAAIDRAVARVLHAKFASGVFERPFADADAAERILNQPAHRELALEAARRSIVLLKNDGNLLPIGATTWGTIAVIGPNAAGLHLGAYSADPGRGVPVLDGIRAAAGPAVRVTHAEGVRITENEPSWGRDEVLPGDPELNRTRIMDAVSVARGADLVILVVGTNLSVSREAWSDHHLGDAATLELPGHQMDLVTAVTALGKPVVAVLINGRPLALTALAAAVPALLECWYPGQEGGTAVGEVLFGRINPGGKLPVSLPRTVGQVPVHYNRKPTSFRSYLFMDRAPLFPFGFGLSYTTFAIGPPSLTPAAIEPGGTARVSVDVTNTGARAGDEVVQLYVRDRVSSVTRPVKELKGFARVSLEPGETRTIAFDVGFEALSFFNRSMERVVEPGTFDLLVGTSSASLQSVTLEVR